MKTREIQGKLWSTAPKDWANFLEPTFIPLYQAVLRQIHLEEDMVLLDAGCGSGLFLTMASTSSVKIYGIDASQGLLNVTKKRVPEGTFLIEDLEDVPFADNSFDIVTGFNSFQYAGNAIEALGQARRVVRPGGKIILGLWDDAKFCDASSVFASIAGLLPPTPAGAPGPYALSAEGTIEKISKQLQLTVLHKEKVSCPWLFTNLRDLYKAFMCTGPAVKASEMLGDQELKKLIKHASQPYCLANDIYFMNNYFKFFILQK